MKARLLRVSLIVSKGELLLGIMAVDYLEDVPLLDC
jgi:hypothetical protein